jgi:hypothetical protein
VYSIQGDQEDKQIYMIFRTGAGHRKRTWHRSPHLVPREETLKMVARAVRSTAGKAKESVRYSTARRGRSVVREAEDPNKPGAGEQQTTSGSSLGPTEKWFAYGLPGSTLPIRNFDPLGFSNADKLEVMRCATYAHHTSSTSRDASPSAYMMTTMLFTALPQLP